MKIFRLTGLALTAWIAAAEPQRPARGSASQVVQMRWEEIAPRAQTESSEPRLGLQVHAPLGFKDRWEIYPLEAISPAMERLLAPAPAAPAPRAVAPATPRLLTGFRGAPDDLTTIPPDTSGAVGPRHVMTTLNNNFQVQDRDGTLTRRVPAKQFFGRLGPFGGSIFDPRVVYDSVSGRWFAVALADARLPTSAICLAVSDTADPSGAWTQARIRADAANSLWFDYPNIAMSGDRLVVAVNIFRRDLFQHSEIFLLNRADLLRGRFEFRRFTEARGSPLSPSSSANLPRIPVVTQSGNVAGQAALRIGEITGPAGAELYESLVRVVPAGEPYSFAPLDLEFGPQAGSSVRISTNDARMQNCVAAAASFYCAHHIFLPAGSPQRAAVQFYELSLGEYDLLQSGRVEDETGQVQYAFPSIAVNGDNDVLLGYSRFAPDQFATAAYSMRLAADPPGQLQPDTLLKRGEASYQRGSTENRWGDYSATVVDPADGVSFWTVQSFAASTASGGGNRWGTWWGRIEPRSAPCTFGVSPLSLSVGPGASTVSVTVTAAAGCRWMSASDGGWITVTSPPNGDGNGTVTATIAVNPFLAPRTSSLTLAGQVITIQQEGNPSPPATRLRVSYFVSVPNPAIAGERLYASVLVSNVSDVTSGSFQFGYFLGRSANVTTSDTRLGGCSFTDSLEPQTGASCIRLMEVPANLSPGTYFLAAIADERRETSMTDRSEAVLVSPALHIAPSRLAPVFSAQSIAHGATAAAGALAPGQIVVIYGNRLGPETLRSLRLDERGLVATELDGTRVLFNGIAAPLIYTSAGQVSCVVPYGVAAGTATVQVEYQSLRSLEIAVPIAAAAPGVFTLDFSGRGQGAIVNDAGGQVNGPANPAPRGSAILIYATGGGALNPGVVDGSVTGPPLPALVQQPVEVTLGGVPATILYAGPAPGLVSGVLQINAIVPTGVTPGNAVPLTLRIGGATAPAGVTVAIR